MHKLKPIAAVHRAFFARPRPPGSFPSGEESTRGLLEDIQHALHWIAGEEGVKLRVGGNG